MPKHLFLSLDGIDGGGKSTQGRRLAEWLRAQGRTVVECVDPGGTPLGQALRDLLLDHRQTISLRCEALLFMASRAQLVAEVIAPALAAGQIVLSDRFLLANVVYQGHAGGLDPEELWTMGRLATGGLEPDLAIVLDLPLEVARTRQKASADRMERKGQDFLQKVREGFLKEAQFRPHRIAVVNAAQPAERVQDELRTLIRRLLDRSGA